MSELEPKYAEVLDCLGDIEMRATYGAVGDVTGDNALSVGAHLGRRRRGASWVVSSKSGLPSGYEGADLHPRLMSNDTIIRTGVELRRYLNSWRKDR